MVYRSRGVSHDQIRRTIRLRVQIPAPRIRLTSGTVVEVPFIFKQAVAGGCCPCAMDRRSRRWLTGVCRAREDREQRDPDTLPGPRLLRKCTVSSLSEAPLFVIAPARAARGNEQARRGRRAIAIWHTFFSAARARRSPTRRDDASDSRRLLRQKPPAGKPRSLSQVITITARSRVRPRRSCPTSFLSSSTSAAVSAQQLGRLARSSSPLSSSSHIPQISSSLNLCRTTKSPATGS